jgi:hypothetical protein
MHASVIDRIDNAFISWPARMGAQDESQKIADVRRSTNVDTGRRGTSAHRTGNRPVTSDESETGRHAQRRVLARTLERCLHRLRAGAGAKASGRCIAQSAGFVLATTGRPQLRAQKNNQQALGESGVTTALSPSRIARVIDGGLQAARCRVSGMPPHEHSQSCKRLIQAVNRDCGERHPPSPASSFKPMNEHCHSISATIAACLMIATSDIPPIICQ